MFAASWWPGGDTTLGWDMLNQYWGDLAFQARHALRGELPAWNPYERLGYAIYGDPQAGQLYPPNWLLYPLAWLDGGVPWWAPMLKAWLHLTAGAVGMLAFLRRRERSTLPAVAGALIFTLAVPMMLNVASALLWPLAWLPWVLVALDRALDDPRPRAGAWLGLAVGGAVLAGAPQALLMVLICGTFFGASRLLEALRELPPGGRRPYLSRLAACLGLGVAVTLLAGLPALLPVPEVVAASVRAERSADFVLKSRADEVLLSVLLPRLGTHRFHYGLFTVCVGLLAVVRRPARNLWAGLLFALGALLAAGGEGPVLAWLARLLAFFGLFRGPHRYAFLATVAMAAAAAAGVGLLMRAGPAERRRAAIAIGGVATVAFVIDAAGLWVLWGLDDARVFVWGATLAAITWVVAALAVRLDGRRLGVVALLAVAGGLIFGSGKGHTYNAFPRPELSPDAVLAGLSPDPWAGRIYDDRFLNYRPGARLELRDASGYERDPLRGRRYDEIMAAVRRRPARLGHLGVVYALQGAHPKMKSKVARLGRDHAFVRIQPSVRRARRVAPAVYVAPSVLLVPGDEVLARWFGTRPGTSAVVAEEDATDALRALAGPPTLVSHPGQLTALTPDTLSARVTGPGVAVFTESWHPDWRATVDGEPATVHRVNHDFRGVIVPPGEHVIHMTFAPAKQRVCIAASVATMLLLLGLLVSRPANARTTAPARPAARSRSAGTGAPPGRSSSSPATRRARRRARAACRCSRAAGAGPGAGPGSAAAGPGCRSFRRRPAARRRGSRRPPRPRDRARPDRRSHALRGAVGPRPRSWCRRWGRP